MNTAQRARSDVPALLPAGLPRPAAGDLRGVLRAVLPPALALGLLLGVWEAYADLVLGAVAGGDRLLPAPSRIVAALVTNTPILAPHAAQTLIETVIGFAAALVVGLGLALVIDLSPWLRRAIYPLLVVS